MIAHKKEFYGGMGMMAGVIVVLILVFMPLFAGHIGLVYLDNLYTSISKGSADYIPKVKEKAGKFMGKSVSVTLVMAEEERARQTTPLFEKGDATVNISGKELKVSGDLGKILDNCLADADLMYKNEGEEISAKYGYEAKRVLLNWWVALHHMESDLKHQKKFKEAKVVSVVVQKAVELGYNYYKIEPEKIGKKIGIVIFSLVFYVAYTMWYGFSILFMFEGWGLKLEH